MAKVADSHAGNNLDLMRLCFAAMVLVSHAAEIVDGDRSHEPLARIFGTVSFGELGVDCFFILSGFMIASSWERDPRWTSFLGKRVARIYPGYAVAYLASVAVVGALGAPDAAGYVAGIDWLRVARDVATLHVPSTPPTFVGSHYPAVNGSMWTIRYEFACYIMVMLLGIAGVVRSARATTGLWLACLAGFLVFRVQAHQGGTGAVMGSDAVTMLRLVPMYLAGAAIHKTGIWRRSSPGWVAAAATLLALGLSNPLTAEAAVATVGAYLLFVVGFAPIGHPGARRMPDVSYGVYLYGWPAEKLIVHWWPGAPIAAVFAGALGLSLACGFASWFLVEKPAIALGRMGSRPSRPRLAPQGGKG